MSKKNIKDNFLFQREQTKNNTLKNNLVFQKPILTSEYNKSPQTKKTKRKRLTSQRANCTYTKGTQSEDYSKEKHVGKKKQHFDKINVLKACV